MTKAVDSKRWFKSKKYGWGWGMPQTWQGWVSYGLFISIWLAALAWLVTPQDLTQDLSNKNIAVFVVVLVIDVAGLIYVSFKYGEPPKNLLKHWGKKKK